MELGAANEKLYMQSSDTVADNGGDDEASGCSCITD
jgi:hypothetical protein